MSLLPELNNISPANKDSTIDGLSRTNHNNSMAVGQLDVSRFFSYDLSDLRSHHSRANRSFLAGRRSNVRSKNVPLPFQINSK